jgi:hypothetical protein
MRRSRNAATLAATTAALLSALAPAGARAAVAQTDLGAGRTPTVLVDSAGTAFIAWSDANGSGPVFFCRLPRGATACAGGGPVTFTPPAANDDTFAPPYVLQRPDGSLVLTADRAFNQVIWTSTDGGVTWSPPTAAEGNAIGDINPSGLARLSGDGAGQEVITDTTTGGVDLQFQPFAGPKQTSRTLFGGYEYGGSVAAVAAGETMAAFWRIPGSGGLNSSAFSLYHGAPGTAMNDSTAWSAPAVVDSPADDTRLSQGPAGVGLLENLGSPPSDLVYRRFDAATSTFAAPSKLIGNDTQEEDVAQDGGGRVHAVWVQPDGIYYDRSDDGGATWKGAVAVLSGGFANSHPRVGAAPDGQGWMVYASAGTVHAVPLNYSALGGGTGAGAGGTPRTTSVAVGGDIVTLQTPAGCVRSGVVTAKLFVRARKRKGHVVVKIGRVVFKVDGKPVKTVRHAPFAAVFHLSLAPGSRHTLSARASIRTHGSKRLTKTLKSTFSAC